MSAAVRPDRLTVDELERRVRQAEPDALLVPPRILRRVIKTHRELGGLGLRVPHRKSYIIDRESLLKIATPAELGLTEPPAADTVLLFPRPEPADLENADPAAALRDYWRLLFHTRVHLVIGGRRLDEAATLERVQSLGTVVFDEAREVLRQEQLVFDGAGPAAVYEEFAAVFLELRHFDPRHLPYFFPAAEDLAAVEGVFALDLDADDLLQRTRPEGAADPATPPPPPPPVAEPEEATETDPPAALRSRAEDASRRGNQVRAALLRLKAARQVPPTQAGSLRGPARLEIAKLAGRLQKALRFPERERDDWSRCLWSLAERAARGVWNQEMRLLSDLQKACLDNERELYAADLIEWFVTWFQRPVKRPLPDLPLVLTVQRLRQAQHRLTMARIPSEDRAALSELMASSLAAAEARMRDAFRPQLVGALDKVGLVPANAAERLARDKLVEELLDDIAQRGYLTLGDLRDALARNRLKLPDVNNPVEVLTGDQLIRLNRELARDLDGVYRRGEIYLRWLQRLSSVFYANVVGRSLTLYLLLPLIGSLLILKGTEELANELNKFVLKPLLGSHATEAPMGEVAVTGKHHSPVLPLLNWWSFITVALFLFAVLHAPAFRRGVVLGLWYLWVGVRAILYDVPASLVRLPIVRAVLHGRPYLLFYQYLGKPLAWTLPVALFLRWRGDGVPVILGVSAAFCAAVSVVLNTRLGLVIEETAADGLVRTWQLVRDDLVPGLFRWIMWLSKRLQERIETVRYTVEEWLLFRRGQRQVVFWLKLLLGLPWSVVSYVVRFAVIVLLEPQINPIKHFPVVTVSHKLTFVLIAPLASVLAPYLGWSLERTYALLAFVQFTTPGFFGFLAWELKENWRLYRANQSPTLEPEMVGGHGEYIIHFLRPGFHSGTLPKLFASLRRARGAAARKSEEGLHHVEEELRHFIDRELIAPLAASKAWLVSATVAVGHSQLATNQIGIELLCPGLAPGSCRLVFLNRGGRLVARLDGPGWLAAIEPGPRAAFANALAGLYKRAGVDVVESADGAPPFEFGGHDVTWNDWVECWERDQAGKRHQPLVPGVQLLPA